MPLSSTLVFLFMFSSFRSSRVRNYDQAQLLAIFDQPVEGNGLVSLAHQLIATKLNIAGGKDPMVIQDAVDAADALIGFLVVPPVGSGFLETSETSALVEELDGFNNEDEAHCPLSVEERSWGRVKASYR